MKRTIEFLFVTTAMLVLSASPAAACHNDQTTPCTKGIETLETFIQSVSHFDLNVLASLL